MPNSMPRLLGRRKKSLANLVLVIPAFVMMGCISFGLFWLTHEFQAFRCPSGTFLVGSGRIASILQIIPVLLTSMAPGFIIANWLAHVIRSARNFFDRDAELHGEPGYYKSQRGLLVASAVVLAIAMPISIGASISQFCLAPNGINYQPWLWSGLRHYNWNDVNGIETNCVRGSKGTWNASFILILRGGLRIDIMETPKRLGLAYPALSSALHPLQFSFDSSGVGFGCNMPYAYLLFQRP
jgi:hypothetical protein